MLKAHEKQAMIEQLLLEQAGSTDVFRRVNVAQVARDIGVTHTVANRVLHSLVERQLPRPEGRSLKELG